MTGASTTTATMRQRWQAVMMNNYGTPPIALASGDGAVVTDVDGRTYIDLLGGDAVNVLVLAVLAALAAAFGPAGMTARDSMLPEAAARAGWSLDRINGAYEAILNLAFIVGPAIGGLMIATVGGITTMWITATAFGLSILAIAALQLAGCRQAAPHLAAPRVGIRDRRGAALRLEPAGIAHPRDD